MRKGFNGLSILAQDALDGIVHATGDCFDVLSP